MKEELKALDSIALKVTGFASKIDQEEAIGEFHTIRKALDRKDKLEKVVEIIKTKKVAVDELLHCIDNDNKYPALEEYNAFAGDENSLTQEEYDLLKEILL